MASTQEQKTGIVTSFYDGDSGVITESGSNAPLDFYQPGAQVMFIQGESVAFLKVTTPTGKIIVRDISKG